MLCCEAKQTSFVWVYCTNHTFGNHFEGVCLKEIYSSNHRRLLTTVNLPLYNQYRKRIFSTSWWLVSLLCQSLQLVELLFQSIYWIAHRNVMRYGRLQTRLKLWPTQRVELKRSRRQRDVLHTSTVRITVYDLHLWAPCRSSESVPFATASTL